MDSPVTADRVEVEVEKPKRQRRRKVKQPDRQWESRIVGYGDEAPDQLLSNPRNWRIHPKRQQDALQAVLDRVGWLRPVIVNQTTGHVVDGHLRVSLAISREEPSVPVTYVDLTENEERAMLALHDPLAELASIDQGAYEALIASVGDDELAGLLGAVRAEPPVSGPDDAGEDYPDEDDPPPGHEVMCPGCGHEWTWSPE